MCKADSMQSSAGPSGLEAWTSRSLQMAMFICSVVLSRHRPACPCSAGLMATDRRL